MPKLRSSHYLLILLAVILLAIVSAAIIDQVTRGATLPVAVATTTGSETGAKIGWKMGEQAPDFTLTTTEGHDIRLSDYRGKNVILNFWATWCGPCRYEIPVFKSLNDNLAKLGIVVLAVSTLDSFENAVAYARYNNLNFIIPVDPLGTVSGYYNVRGIPTTFFINAKGVITSVKIGPFINENEVLDKVASFN
jgi:peroxiredoxin